MPLSGSYERPIRSMRAAREILIRNPPRIGDAIRELESAIVDLGGAKNWGAPSRIFESSEGQVEPLTRDEVKDAVAQLQEAIDAA